jgi:hypothetical protein
LPVFHCFGKFGITSAMIGFNGLYRMAARKTGNLDDRGNDHF